MAVAGLVLAAGRASRMGRDKRLLPVGGVPMILRAVAAARDGGLGPVFVVRGPEPLDLLPADVVQVVNPNPADGMGRSLALGVAALPGDARAVVVLLADMPGVDAGHVRRLVAAFAPDRGVEIVVPTHHGRRGNPVLLGRRFFAAMAQLTGDKGARALIGQHGAVTVELDMDEAVVGDIDTPADFDALNGGGA